MNWLKVFRVKEVLPGMAPILLASLDATIINLPKILVLSVGFLITFFSVFLINEYIDSFDTDKFNLERGKGITKHNVPRQFTLISYVITSILGVIILSSLGLFWVAIIGFLFSVFYSVPPIRLKSRPFLDLLAVTVGFVFLPYLSFLYLNQASVNILVLIFFATGFMAIDLVAEGADYDADKQAKITTTAVFLGEKNNLILIKILSLISTVSGILTIIFTGHWWYIYIVAVIFFLFTAAQWGLTIYKDHDRLHELLRTGEKFGVFASDFGLGILLIIWSAKWLLSFLGF